MNKSARLMETLAQPTAREPIVAQAPQVTFKPKETRDYTWLETKLAEDVAMIECDQALNLVMIMTTQLQLSMTRPIETIQLTFTTAANDALVEASQSARSVGSVDQIDKLLKQTYNRLLKRYKILFDVVAMPPNTSQCKEILVDAIMAIYFMAVY